MMLGSMIVALLAECATNVALPLSRFSENLPACVAPPPISEAQARIANLEATTIESRREAFESGLDRYRAFSFVTRLSNAGVGVLTNHPLVRVTPGVSVAAELVNDYTKDALEGLANDNLETYLRQNIRTYLVENPTLGSLQDAQNLEAFSRYMADKVDTERFGAVSQEIDIFLARQLATQSERLEAYRLETRTELGRIEGDIERLRQFQTQAAADQNDALEGLRSEFQGAVNSAVGEIQRDLQAAVRAQEVMAAEQGRTFSEVRAVRQDVDAQRQQIVASTRQIRALEVRVSDLSAGQERLRADVTSLSQAQQRTAERLEQNEYRVDAVAAVLWDQGDPATRLRLLDTGAVRVQDETTRTRLRQSIQADISEMVATQERAAIAARLSNVGDAIDYGKRGVALAARNGLSADDARRANKILSYAQVAVGVGRLYYGDINGLGNVMGGLESLSNPSGESATDREIREGFRQINARLDVVILQNEQLSRDLADFRNWSAEAHLETQRQFAELERLSEIQQRSLDYIARLVAQADPPTCRQMAGPLRDALGQAVRQSRSFGELRDRWQGNATAGSIVRCLVEIAGSATPTDFGFVHEADRGILLQAYPLIAQRRNATLLPRTFDGTCPNAPLLSDEMVMIVARAALDFDTLVYGYAHQDQDLADFTIFSMGRHRDSHRTVEQLYANVAALLDCAISQQAVLHGGHQADPVLNAVQAVLSGSGTGPLPARLFAASLLRTNLATFRRNLAVRVVATEFAGDPDAFALVGQGQTACGSDRTSGVLNQLNRRIRSQRFQFVEVPFHLDERCSLQIRFVIAGADNGEPQTVTLVLPDVTTLRRGEVIVPASLDAMLQLRIAVEDRRNAYAISDGLLAPQGYGSATLNFGGQQ